MPASSDGAGGADKADKKDADTKGADKKHAGKDGAAAATSSPSERRSGAPSTPATTGTSAAKD